MRVPKSLFFSFLPPPPLLAFFTDGEMLFCSRCVRLCSAQPHAGRLSGRRPDVLECAEVQPFSLFFSLMFFFIFHSRGGAARERANTTDAGAQVYSACGHVQIGNLDGAFLRIFTRHPSTHHHHPSDVRRGDKISGCGSDAPPPSFSSSYPRFSPHLLLFVLPASCVSLWR